MIVPMCKDKGEKTECSNYRGISLLSIFGKVYAGILLERICKVTEVSMMSKGVSEQEGGV